MFLISMNQKYPTLAELAAPFPESAQENPTVEQVLPEPACNIDDELGDKEDKNQETEQYWTDDNYLELQETTCNQNTDTDNDTFTFQPNYYLQSQIKELVDKNVSNRPTRNRKPPDRFRY